VKKLFGSDEAPLVTPVPAAVAAPVVETKPKVAERGDRGDGRGQQRGERGGRGGERGGRGGRGGERGEREGREGRGEARRGEGREQREPRENREGRGDNRRTEGQQGPRDPQQPAAQPPREAREPRESREPRETREPREPRPPRGEGGRRHEAPAAKPEADLLPAAQLALIDGAAVPAATDALLPPAEGDANGEGARRRRRRGGRGRNRGEGAPGDAATNGGEEAALDGPSELSGSEVPQRSEAFEPVQPEPFAMVPAEPVIEAPVVPAPMLPEPVVAARPIVVPAPTPAATAKAEPYMLPIDRLNAVASAAGLEWVHSDSDKVRAAQSAIAAEAKPPRVPRQPKPAVAIDDGPLILVETKKDLSQIKLPFDRG
jgi:ribonuclease E